MKKEMQKQDNEMDRWMKQHASTTLPAAIKAIEKIKKEEMDDDISDVVLPTYCYNKWSVPPRVLLVDDQGYSTRLLEYAGCTIEVAVDGADALDKLTRRGYDLVVMVRASMFFFLEDAKLNKIDVR
jgi:PleD family two-component response regulator